MIPHLFLGFQSRLRKCTCVFTAALLVHLVGLTSACTYLDPQYNRQIANLSNNLSAITPSWLSVTLYHPEQGLHEPTVVDIHAKNLTDTKIRVTCVANESIAVDEARTVCRNVAKMLRQQGAETDIFVPRKREEAARKPNSDVDLDVEIRSRIHRAHFDNVAATFFCCTCALTPTKMEQAYIHSIRVRGRNGVTLSEHRMQSRFVQYTGCGVAGINALLDFFFREDHEKLGGDTANRDFSADFYRQIAQLAFNAKMRSDVLGLTRAHTSPRFQKPVAENVETNPNKPETANNAENSTTSTQSDEDTPSPPVEPAAIPDPASPPLDSPTEAASPPPAPEPTAPVVDPDDDSAANGTTKARDGVRATARMNPTPAPLLY